MYTKIEANLKISLHIRLKIVNTRVHKMKKFPETQNSQRKQQASEIYIILHVNIDFLITIKTIMQTNIIIIVIIIIVQTT